jgi:hypothetical protein
MSTRGGYSEITISLNVLALNVKTLEKQLDKITTGLVITA